MDIKIVKIISGKMIKRDESYLQIWFEITSENGKVQDQSFFANGKKMEFWIEQKEIPIIDKSEIQKEKDINELERLRIKYPDK